MTDTKKTTASPAEKSLTLGEGVALTKAETEQVRDALQFGAGGDYSDLKRVRALDTKRASYVGSERKARALSRVFGAVAVHAFDKAGAFADESGTPGTWKSRAAYARDTDQSTTNVAGLLNLGRAIAVGFDPTFPMWSVASDKAATKAFGEIVAKAKSGAAIDKAVHAAFKAAKKETTEPRATADEKNATDGAEGTDAPAVQTKPTVASVLAQVSTLADSIRDAGLTADEWSRVEDALAKIVEREVTLRLKATPATVAKKATGKAA